MAADKNVQTGSTTMLILRLLEEKEMYGYEMIEQLAQKSNNVFALKAGTLYPILHTLEEQGALTSCNTTVENGRARKYYSITPKGRRLLGVKKAEWSTFSVAINRVLEGGGACAVFE